MRCKLGDALDEGHQGNYTNKAWPLTRKQTTTPTAWETILSTDHGAVTKDLH